MERDIELNPSMEGRPKIENVECRIMKRGTRVMHLRFLRNKQLKIILITLCVFFVSVEARAGSFARHDKGCEISRPTGKKCIRV